MFTPQQIDQISFSKAKFGGYNMEQVDQILEPLTEDYVTLYKENALLKSKMRVLVSKLEEYRKNEATMKDATAEAQRTADKMVMEAQAKCEAMLAKASAASASAAPVDTAAVVASAEADALIAAENARVEEARKVASAKIAEIQEQMRSCIQALDRIKAAAGESAKAPEAPKAPKTSKATDLEYDSSAVVDEIAQNLEALVGTAENTAPTAAPKHPVSATTSRFANMNLQFGANYDPTRK